MTPRRSIFYAVIVLAMLAASFLAQKPPLLGNVEFSRAVFDRNDHLLRLTLSGDEKYRLYTPLTDISPRLKEAVLLKEDQYFYYHPGVNPAALARAFFNTYVMRNRTIGGSTITMQIARIEYNINSHSIIGKLWQIARALQIEVHYSKDEIFEAYLNRVSYGYNIEGVGAASYIYFHTNPHELTLPEAVTLAVVPQSPYRRRLSSTHPTNEHLLHARNELFGRWLEQHPDDITQKPFFELPLMVGSVADLPHEAPHLTHYLLAHDRGKQQITASIDLDTQQLLESILKHYVADRQDAGITNASALLVDTRNMQAIASIGSADFANHLIHGQVDGTRAKRSPGSTLKPFIYALALDQGLIHPLSILGDTPVNFGSYTPDNFDHDFRGPLSARDALRMSRNIPAIKLAAQLHSPDLYDFLREAGITGLRDRKDYGLSLVLGGAEVTERELAGLYAMLANDGVMQPVAFELNDSEVSPGKQLLSPEASFMALDMLADAPKPYTREKDRVVYWKTGTSNGFRDAWTAGVFGHYALVVWVGNFGGEDNPALVGLRTAAPLFFALADAANAKAPNHELIAQKPAHLRIRKIDVCTTTGDLTTEDCPSHDSVWFIPGVSPIQNHDIYRRVLVDMHTGKRACHEQDGVTTYRTFEVWPSDLQQALERAGIHKAALPVWDDGCIDAERQATNDGEHPVIMSPQAGVQYHAHVKDLGEAISFSASADGDVRALHWFLDNEYLGSSAPGKSLLWKAQPGHYAVRVVDDQGRADATSMIVTAIQ